MRLLSLPTLHRLSGGNNMSQFDGIIKYILRLESGEPFATIIREEMCPGVISLPVIKYTPLAKEIISAFHAITESREDYSVDNLLAFYDRSPFAESVITQVNVSELDEKSVLALLAAVIHMERWDNGTLHTFYTSGKLLECLKRLSVL